MRCCNVEKPLHDICTHHLSAVSTTDSANTLSICYDIRCCYEMYLWMRYTHIEYRYFQLKPDICFLKYDILLQSCMCINYLLLVNRMCCFLFLSYNSISVFIQKKSCTTNYYHWLLHNKATSFFAPFFAAFVNTVESYSNFNLLITSFCHFQLLWARNVEIKVQSADLSVLI